MVNFRDARLIGGIHEIMATLEPDVGTVTSLEDSATWAHTISRTLQLLLRPQFAEKKHLKRCRTVRVRLYQSI